MSIPVSNSGRNRHFQDRLSTKQSGNKNKTLHRNLCDSDQRRDIKCDWQKASYGGRFAWHEQGLWQYRSLLASCKIWRCRCLAFSYTVGLQLPDLPLSGCRDRHSCFWTSTTSSVLPWGTPLTRSIPLEHSYEWSTIPFHNIVLSSATWATPSSFCRSSFKTNNRNNRNQSRSCKDT